ncbi:MAG: hypothetical protein GF401_10365 [Chitinivibrionales bacterium]|nr:hypothetical protein [Chitinivibrionales bacterium]
MIFLCLLASNTTAENKWEQAIFRNLKAYPGIAAFLDVNTENIDLDEVRDSLLSLELVSQGTDPVSKDVYQALDGVAVLVEPAKKMQRDLGKDPTYSGFAEDLGVNPDVSPMALTKQIKKALIKREYISSEATVDELIFAYQQYLVDRRKELYKEFKKKSAKAVEYHQDLCKLHSWIQSHIGGEGQYDLYVRYLGINNINGSTEDVMAELIKKYQTVTGSRKENPKPRKLKSFVKSQIRRRERDIARARRRNKILKMK